MLQSKLTHDLGFMEYLPSNFLTSKLNNSYRGLDRNAYCVSSTNGSIYGSMPYDPVPLSPRRVSEVQRLLYQREKKAKTSVSLSGELIRASDAIAGTDQRSAFVERAVRAYIKAMIRRAQRAHDLAAINAHAATTNRESGQLLEIQVWPK